MFHRMQLYTVHVKTDRRGEIKDVVLVREGFNVFAFALSIFWAIFNQAWLFALMVFMCMLVVGLIDEQRLLHSLSVAILQLGIMIMFGFLANDSLRDSLKRRGYKQTCIVAGENKTRAEMRFFDQYTAVPA